MYVCIGVLSGDSEDLNQVSILASYLRPGHCY